MAYTITIVKQRATSDDIRYTTYNIRFIQNKPNLQDTQMNVSSIKIKSYDQLTMNNEPIKQTQTKPTCSELVEPISNVNLLKWVALLHTQLNIQAKFVYNVFILR